MKILYLKLKNFIGIYNGMRRTEIELDFSKSKNKFVLIVGKNGSGKSTILNALHPFSSNIEEKSTFIRPGKDGYKEIHIFNENNIFIIKHYYKSSKTGHNIKSYISKLDKIEIELNPTGNVESFLEQVLICLKVDFSFLKLSSLGKDIINFIDFKAADRKKYIGNMLKDINAYEKYYKRVTDISKRLQNSIKTISSKIDSINNKEHIDSSLLYVENMLEEKSNLKERILTEIGYIQSIVQTSEDIESILKNINEFETNEQEIKRIKKILDSIPQSNINEYDKKIEKIQNKIIELKSSYSSTEQRIIEIHENIERLKFQITENQTNLTSPDNNEDIKLLIEMKKQYLEKLELFDKNFQNKEIVITKEDLLIIENFLDDIAKSIESLQSNYSIAELNKCYMKGTKNINEKSIVIQKQLEQCNIGLAEARLELRILNENIDKYDSMISLRPKNCVDNNCPFIKDFIEYKDLRELLPEKSGRVVQLETSLINLQNDSEFYKSCVVACRDIDNILMNINIHKNLLNKVSILKKTFLEQNKFINSIVCNSLNFSDIRNKLYILYSIAEDFEEYKLIKNEKLPTLSILIMTKQKYDDIQQDIDKIEAELKNYYIKLEKLDENKIKLEHNIQEYQTRMNEIKNYYNLFNKYTTLILKQDILEKEYKKYHDKIDMLKNTSKRIKDINKNLITLNQEIVDLTKKRDSLIHQKKTLKDLKEERALVHRDFKEISLIKDAVSNTKGIPLLFINIYLEETKNIANKLLELAFDGEFYIDDFIINESEFRIPCTGRGEQNSDVQTASGGERIMTSLAMSFALIQQSNYQYNIILLDEMDGELDKRNRKLFLHILEKQCSVINSDQIFVITHNNEFDSYPGDLILLSGHDVENYNNKNVIFQYQ